MRFTVTTGPIAHGTPRFLSRASVAAGILCAGLAGPASAQVKENVILNFDYYNGAYPMAPLLADTTGPAESLRGLYGTAGNEWGAGAAFKLAPPKTGKTDWKETTLWTINKPFDFTGYGPLSASTKRVTGKTALYGTTEYGGNVNAQCGSGDFNTCGTIYSVTGQTMNVLWAFTGGSDGGGPENGVIGDATGALYASAYLGGGPSNCGTVIQLIPPAQGQTAWTENTIWTFTNGNDGCEPSALIMGEAGAIFGVAYGSTGDGTVFELTPPAMGGTAWTEQTIWTFQGSDGAVPTGVTPKKGGGLYVVTAIGGNANGGTVVELTPPGKGQTAWTEHVIWSFTGGADGSTPIGPVIIDKAGALYATTSVGGSMAGGCDDQGCGAAFKLTPPPKGQTAWTETTLWSFSGNADGGEPMATLTADTSGTLYGTASSGGSESYGVVFSLTGTGFVP
jgi:hypothetical protein